MGNSPTKVDEIRCMNVKFIKCVELCKQIENDMYKLEKGDYSYTKKDKLAHVRLCRGRDTSKQKEYCINDCRRAWKQMQYGVLSRYS